ncbi:MAG: ABC transporter ATP-binding protein [Paracoccaceae bacterium]
MAPPEIVEKRHLLWRLFFENGVQHWRAYAIALSFMGVVAAMTGLSAWIMRDVINEIFVERRQDVIPWIALAVAAIFLVKGGATYVQMVILNRTGNKIVAAIQTRLFDHVLAQRVDFFDTYSIGDLATRISNNAQSAREAINLVVTRLGRDLLSLVALVIVMVVQNPKLSLIALVIAPPAIWGVSKLIRKIKAIARAEFISMAKIVTTIQETAQGARVVKAFGLEDQQREAMGGAIDGVRRRADAIATIQAAPIPLMESLAGLAIAAIVLYAGWQVADGQTDPGVFFSFITALLLAYDPARRVAQLSVTLQAHLIGVELMYQLLDERPRIAERPDARALKVGGGAIAFENVVFRYGKVPALAGFSMVAEAGRVTALVGPSGAGKSTVFALLERFYDPDRGRIAIDGQDLREVTFASLREAVAYVGQDAFLFEGTIADNIRRGRLSASDAEVEEAARAANAHDFVTALPDGYEATVGENGARLSGGQRQRIAIARAMLKRAPILLLDEPTSALDAEAEAHVAEALERLMQGRTTLVIAHRLSTVRHADRIHVVDAGRIVQSGTHDGLIAEGGLYARLYALQFADTAPRPAAPGDARDTGDETARETGEEKAARRAGEALQG